MDRRNVLKYSMTGLLAMPFISQQAKADLVSKAQDLTSRLSSSDNDENYWELVKKEFDFAPGLHYFNNASLGPSPKLVVDATNHYRALLDGFPSKYMWGGWAKEKEETREKIAGMFGCDTEDIAILHNTTEGMNLVAHSLDLEPGDEIILADHEHNSGIIPYKYWQETRGVKLVRPELPILPETAEDLVEVYRKAITPRTKLISMVHATNTNGMILPVKKVSQMAHERGILVAVDAAQTAGTFQIDLHDLECDFYAASAHKFVFAPKGTGVFYAKKDAQELLKPLIVSAQHYKDKSIRRLENYNTRNLPELLGLGMAVDYYNLIGGEKREKRLYDLKNYLRDAVASNSKLRMKTPAANDLSCCIQSVEVVGRKVNEVKEKLFESFGIDCRPMSSHSINGCRISLSVFTTKKDVDYLMNAFDSV